MNGVSSVSRLLGCYHLWPQVIPAPSIESVQLRTEDQYIVIGTDGLWKHVSYEQVVHQIQSISDPIQASKCLREMAITQGCKQDISVVVVKLNIDREIPKPATAALIKQRAIVDAEGSEDEEEDVAITNIDDVLTESEEEEEEEEEENGDHLSHHHQEDDVTNQDNTELDRLVLSAVHSPTSSPFKPTLESTNFDDPDEPLTPPSVGMSTHSDLTNYYATNNRVVVMPEMEYEAQTLPSATKQRKNSQEVPVNGGYAILAETSFEQTQVIIIYSTFIPCPAHPLWKV